MGGKTALFYVVTYFTPCLHTISKQPKKKPAERQV
ncbi:hypothetical protein N872_11395 [Neisseria meningitidis LNP27256]|uniref:Uncharacterized protein n=3 Tax=Neisseria meningitidis TaxID=487 RepID=C6SJN6_NEIME|nr:hypothetical protein N872_11395 [Neisseria meningitidis LNP27256]CBA04484.1 hypothetical protein predicted by Glimmer/Critica [Neisseria meningitidis alpha153]CBA07327.1 hypothetical protein predicted by Glimmer/Critica [Neisseria meningitidis alpha275]CCA44369.1 hypothetical protein NMALPHA522_0828 [Neisseria meningitidis alpha522]